MAHDHRWTVLTTCLLSLPKEGWAERFIAWRCQHCGLEERMTGLMMLGIPLGDPDFWKQRCSTPVRAMWRPKGMRLWPEETP